MIKNETLSFLKTLERNNNRVWFNENKDQYEKAKDDVLSFVETLIQEIAEFDEEILKIDPKKSLFRIYRDTRFSKDKTPYKTHFGVSLGMGKGSKISGYYLHIEPGKSFLAGGVYNPEPAILKEIRKEISASGDDFLKILEQNDFRNNFRGLSVESKLKRVPTGFEKNHPMAEYLKLKSFTVSHPVSDDSLFAREAAKNFAEIFRSIQPLNNFLELPFH
ncbi:DUF2461 domain-containing protein [Chryseobacterium gotjawalense]|uniref:TIGR02453 family protein n=2 Tax=Chryseobacterium TaxID=59732 RepID=A0A4P6ZBY9_9FLAO|nr:MULTISPECIES: DUF2461 domain-containing protein [Chryseobacterium]MDQ0476529.1 uncharacterized protein (TIGR02453 family) [Chryseobacterium sp. MDT2-18]QBO56905.1 hypothetical protein NBC122_00045 [Chryseobacterium salivictor]WHF52748.1 DUF2461 domain-containing protein [Chryseobacterium sp. wdc7]